MDSQAHQTGAPSQPLLALGQMLERVTLMQREEAATTRHFLGGLQDQAQLHSMALERLLAGQSSAAPVPAGPSGLAGVVLQRMTAEDDAQSYLETVTLAEDHLAVHGPGKGEGERPPSTSGPLPGQRRKLPPQHPALWPTPLPRVPEPVSSTGPGALPSPGTSGGSVH